MRALSKLVLILLLAAQLAAADIALVQVSTLFHTSADVGSFTIGGAGWPANNTAGNLIVLFVIGISKTTGQALANGDVTDGTNAYQKDVGNDAAAGAEIFGGIWSTIEASGGTKRTLTFDPAGAEWHYYTAFAAEFSGVADTAYTDGSNTGAGSSTNPTINVNVGTAGSMLLGACGWDTSGTDAIAPGANYSAVGEEENGASYVVAAAEYDLSASSGSVAINWTRATSPWEIYACAYKVAGGAPPSVVPQLMYYYRQQQ
jgi:hypothetical protein